MLHHYLSARLLLFVATGLCWMSCNREVKIREGLKLSASTKVSSQHYILKSRPSTDQPLISISGEDIVIDFQHAVIESHRFSETPDRYEGLAIRIADGRNITIKNLTIRGFMVALQADDIRNLKLENIDASYNYRQKLKSTREREDLGDWMSYHDNEGDEWLRFGAAFYLKNCDSLEITECRVTQGQCALMLTECDDGLIYNNTFHFNSAIGIGLYRSSRNRIMHNRLDWNVRGYSHGIYRRGQDSAGILCYEQSSDNEFAYNSATHSGDGFFLWAGHSTIQTGEGGCNDNLIYRNDFSHAPTNGVEITFSSNRVIENLLNDCRYGIWAGYSHHCQIAGNQIKGNEFGIAVEHGNHFSIRDNFFENDSLGIQLWERENQPQEWKFARIWNISSSNYVIADNRFKDVQYPFHIVDSDTLEVSANAITGEVSGWYGKNNGQLNFIRGDAAMTSAAENLSVENIMEGTQLLADPIPGGKSPYLDATHPRGIQFIFINEWGPYNFEYPAIFLVSNTSKEMGFSLFGPAGNWKITGADGIDRINQMTGRFPANLLAEKSPDAEVFEIQFEFIGEELKDQFGHTYSKGEIYPFDFRRFEKALNWRVSWSSYPEDMDPIQNYPQWNSWVRDNLSRPVEVEQIAYRWWSAPADGIDPDRFATIARTEEVFEQGKYRIILTSDDGVKLFVDGKLSIDHWDIHVPETDTLDIELDGVHRFEIEHFEGGGLATLDFRMEKIEIELLK